MHTIPHQLYVSCEHGSSHVPEHLRPFFVGDEHMWNAPESCDTHALAVARAWSKSANAPLTVGTVSRLVCDVDRNTRNPAVWSPWTTHIPLDMKTQLLETFYTPYRNALASDIRKLLHKGVSVLHLSLRSFPATQAPCTINLCYKTHQPEEKHIACAWQAVLRRTAPLVRLRRNAPMFGGADSFINTLREDLQDKPYLAFGVHCVRGQNPTLQAAVLGAALRKVLLDAWR